MPNVNIPETENNKCVWTQEVRRRRQPLKKIMDTEKIRRGRPIRRWLDNIGEDMKKYEMTADLAENSQYMEMMEKTGPQTCGVGI